MKEYPILFSSEMVQAILEDRKTQTRRVIKPQPPELWGGISEIAAMINHSPYGKPGDRLWVRETWTTHENDKGADCLLYKADVPDPENYGPWRPSIFMPRWASRITLEVVGVRVQQVQDISHTDAIAEGVEDTDKAPYGFAVTSYAIANYRVLWNLINAKRGFGWAVNPWVWAIEFRRLPA